MSRNKLKVSTRTIEKQRKINRIIEILKRFPEGATPKIIAFHTRINVNTVKSLLPEIPEIKKKMRGLYIVEKSRYDENNIFDWNFHNCILSVDLPEYVGELIKETYSFGFVNYEFTIGAKSKKATLRISTELPINISSICACYSFFAALIKEYIGLTPKAEDILIKSVEFNKDYVNLRLDGANCITLESLLSQFKIYQKKLSARVEHKLKVPIGLDLVFSMLNKSAISIDLCRKIEKLEEQQESMARCLKSILNLIGQLLNKLDKISIKKQ